MGKKGSRYGGGFITEPISAYFKTRHRVVLEIQIPKTMQLFHATNNRYPKDMAEFERVILKPNGITALPELPDGQRYVYDPKAVNLPANTGLMVERPK